MKRVLYGIFAAGLALSLAGCGESGGGYWPNTPTQAAGDQQVVLVGNTNAVANTVVLSSNGVSSAVAAGVGACPVMADFGVSLPSSLGGTPITPAASVLGASRSRTKSDATAKGMALVTDASNYNKFTYKTSGSSLIGGTYSMEYTWYVKFLKADGTALALNTSSTDFYAFTGATTADVNGIEFYGDWTYSTKYAGSTTSSTQTSCSIRASSSSSSSSSVASEYTMKGTFGSSSAPCVVTNLSSASNDAHVYARYNGSFTTAGTFGGSAYAATVTSKTYGTASLGSYTGMFKYPKTLSSSNLYGNGTYEINDGTTKVELVAEGTTYKIFVNGQAI